MAQRVGAGGTVVLRAVLSLRLSFCLSFFDGGNDVANRLAAAVIRALTNVQEPHPWEEK